MRGFGQIDPMYPGGCPTGFTLQELYYVPNSEATNVTAATPGAVPLPGNQYACMNASGVSPLAFAQSNGSQFAIYTQMPFLAILAAGVAALLLGDGLMKLLGVAVVGCGVVAGGLTYQNQAQVQTDGSIKCVITGASGF